MKSQGNGEAVGVSDDRCVPASLTPIYVQLVAPSGDGKDGEESRARSDKVRGRNQRIKMTTIRFTGTRKYCLQSIKNETLRLRMCYCAKRKATFQGMD